MNCITSAKYSTKFTCGLGFICTILAVVTAAVAAIAFFIFSAPPALIIGGIGMAVLCTGGAIAAFVRRSLLIKEESAFSVPDTAKRTLNSLLVKSGYTVDSLPFCGYRGQFEEKNFKPPAISKCMANGEVPQITVAVRKPGSQVPCYIILRPIESSRINWQQFKPNLIDKTVTPVFFWGTFTAESNADDSRFIELVDKDIGFSTDVHNEPWELYT